MRANARYAVLFILAILMTGCAFQGGMLPEAKSFQEKALVSENGIEFAVESVAAAAERGFISRSEAISYREVLWRAHEILGLAEEMHARGDLSTAQEQLALAEALLLSIRQRLASAVAKSAPPPVPATVEPPQ